MTPDKMTDAQFENIFGFSRNPKPPAPFAKWEQPYSSKELASYKAARALVVAINAKIFDFGQGVMTTDPPLPAQRPMGGGVIDGDDEATSLNTTSDAPPGPPVGIFIPPFFGLAPRSEVGPDETKYFELHLRFKNGAIIDVGLLLDKLSRYPLSQSYAVNQIAAEVEQSGATA